MRSCVAICQDTEIINKFNNFSHSVTKVSNADHSLKEWISSVPASREFWESGEYKKLPALNRS